MPFEYNIRTRYSETAQDGIIHHSSFVTYLEEARIAYLQKLGCDVNDLEKKGFFCPVIDLSIKYIKPLQSLEDLTLQVWVESFSKVRFTLSYKILKGKDLCATASTSGCLLNNLFKPIALPLDLLETLNKESSCPI
ncbi:MAG: thioesterase family protein [Chlamydiota bacterium]